MKNIFVAALAVASFTASFASAEETSHGTKGSQSGTGGDHSSVNNAAEKPDPVSGSVSPTSTMPVSAGRIMSPKELNKAGLKPDDVIMHVSVS